jgi:hypothetical protein
MDPATFMSLMDSGDFAPVIGEEKAKKLTTFLRSQLQDHEASVPVYIKVIGDEGDYGLWLVFHLHLVSDTAMGLHILIVTGDGETLHPRIPEGYEGRPYFSAEMIRSADR